MMENLSDMVKSDTTENSLTFNEESLNELEKKENAVKPVEVKTEETDSISITSLGSWFNNNVNNFPNIKKPNVAVQGVNPNEQLIMTVLVSTEGGKEKRKLIVYDDAHLQPVLNLPAIDMQIYNNGFRIVYDCGNGIFIKSYSVRTGLISVFCNDIDDKLVPYATVKTKKKDTKVDIVERDPTEVRKLLAEPLDFEALQLRYKQSSKSEGLKTNKDGVDWLLERQSDIEDIYHHLQIDNVIIDTLQ